MKKGFKIAYSALFFAACAAPAALKASSVSFV